MIVNSLKGKLKVRIRSEFFREQAKEKTEGQNYEGKVEGKI